MEPTKEKVKKINEQWKEQLQTTKGYNMKEIIITKDNQKISIYITNDRFHYLKNQWKQTNQKISNKFQ